MTHIKKILFLIPPAITFREYRDINPLPPLGLGYLASIAENMGMEVRILDCLLKGWDNEKPLNDDLVRIGLDDAKIRKLIEVYQPDMVGISCQFSRQHRIYSQMLSLIKGTDRKIITVAGGPHVTVCPEVMLDHPDCDFVIIGEGEASFGQLLTFLNENSDFSGIDGLGWKVDHQTRINPKQRWIDDLDSIPFPAYHLMDLELYFNHDISHGTRHRKRFMPIVSSRGCPAKCTFCSAHRVWGRNYRVRSVDHVIAEMHLLKECYGIEEIMFEDDNVTANPKRAKELFTRMIQEDLNFVWDTPNGVGVWSMDKEMINLMQQSGCRQLNFPVESGSQNVLSNIIKKPLKLDRVKELIAHCKSIGLNHGMFLVVGMPGESQDDIWTSFKYAADCGCYEPHISVATPYPGTEFFAECTKDRLFTREYCFEDLFIKSFMIKTKDWSDKELRKILFKGKVYLMFRDIWDNPPHIFYYLQRFLKSPARIVRHFERILGMKKSGGQRVRK